MRVQGIEDPDFQAVKLVVSSLSDSIHTAASTSPRRIDFTLSFSAADFSMSTFFTIIPQFGYYCRRAFAIGTASTITRIRNFWYQGSHIVHMLLGCLWVPVPHSIFQGIVRAYPLITANTELNKYVYAKKAYFNTEVYKELSVSTTRAELPKIRVLIILPGGPQDLIRCQLGISALISSSMVPYEALSYVWGPPDLSQVIEINQRPFSISTPLHDALSRLRYPNSSRRLWVDAICINQADKTERSAQVLLMHQIYSLATRVVVWLGSREPLDLNALNEHTPTDPGLDIQHNDGAIRASSDLLRRPWWTRAWVTQEFVLARDIIFCCGSHIFDQYRFCQIVSACISLPTFPRDSVYLREYQALIRHREERLSCKPLPAAEVPRTTDLLSLVYDFRSKQASDPRDKIIVFQGLSRGAKAATPEGGDPNNLSEILVQPDYDQGPIILCIDLVTQHIRKSGSLSAVALAECARPKPLPVGSFEMQVPSWCPDFVNQESVDRSLAWNPFWTGFPGEPPGTFSPAGTALVEPTPQSKTRYPFGNHSYVGYLEVTVTSNSTDRIRSVGPLAGDSFQSLIPSTTNSSGRCQHPPSSGVDADPVLLAWRKLAREAFDRRNLAPKLAFEDEFSLTITAGRFTAAAAAAATATAKAVNATFLAALGLACAGRRLYTTEKGSFGLGPAGLQIGHEVCVMLGMQTPVILSHPTVSLQPSKPTLWGYVGQAYQHGLMMYEGDINEDIRCGRVSLSIRTLR